ncbi:hypothetical protein ACHAW6_013197 [Cyclotella cf. meneghiniana]
MSHQLSQHTHMSLAYMTTTKCPWYHLSVQPNILLVQKNELHLGYTHWSHGILEHPVITIVSNAIASKPQVVQTQNNTDTTHQRVAITSDEISQPQEIVTTAQTASQMTHLTYITQDNDNDNNTPSDLQDNYEFIPRQS